MGLLTEELDQILLKKDRVVEQIAVEMLGVAQRQTPVGNPSLWKVNQDRKDGKIWRPTGYSGGNLKQSWELFKTKSGWVVSNSANYASIALAVHIPNGKNAQGSSQFPEGIDPHIRNMGRELEERLRRIK